jgi:hypothetical protein
MPDWKTVVASIVLFLVSAAIGAIIRANVETAAQERGWHNLLNRALAKARLPNLRTLRTIWWLWIVLGMVGGISGEWLWERFSSASLDDATKRLGV